MLRAYFFADHHDQHGVRKIREGLQAPRQKVHQAGHRHGMVQGCRQREKGEIFVTCS